LKHTFKSTFRPAYQEYILIASLGYRLLTKKALSYAVCKNVLSSLLSRNIGRRCPKIIGFQMPLNTTCLTGIGVHFRVAHHKNKKRARVFTCVCFIIDRHIIKHTHIFLFLGGFGSSVQNFTEFDFYTICDNR